MSEENEVLAATEEVEEDEEEVEEVEEPAPKKRRGLKPSSKPITGKIKSDDFSSAISEIQSDSYVSSDDVTELLLASMKQAYLEWSYPGLFREKDNDDPAKELIDCEVVLSNTFSSFKIYDKKIVTDEDDIVDDAYQISPEDATAIKEEDSKLLKGNIKLGETVKIKFDNTKLDKSYVRRVKQLFQSKLKEASRTAILNVYHDQIGELIEGTVTRIEESSGAYELSFGKAQGFLKKGNRLPNDRFAVGDKVLVHLSDVSDKSNPPSLVISRGSKEFVSKLIERYVPEVKEGIVTIKAIEREPGKRTKVFVDSLNANIDPVGTCIGPDSSRIRTVIAELRGEKVDIVRYYLNKALQVIEAMKPATVIGVTCPADFFDPNVHFEELEADRDYDYPKITAVVNNGNQGVAIGTMGVNVRLASRITRCTISVLQADDAISSGLKYLMTNDILKAVHNMGGAVPTVAEAAAPVAEEPEEFEEEIKNEEVVPTVAPAVAEEPKPAEAPAVEEKPVETVPAAEPAPAPVAEEPKPAEAPAVEEVKPAVEEKPIEHVEIKNKPKISLEALEQAMSSKKGPSETRSYKKKFKKDKDEENKNAPSQASQVEAMPIYTEEELQAMEDQEAEDNYDEEELDLEEYDSDEYYDDQK